MQDGTDVWEVAIVYTTRWITYIIIWGTSTSRISLFEYIFHFHNLYFCHRLHLHDF